MQMAFCLGFELQGSSSFLDIFASLMGDVTSLTYPVTTESFMEIICETSDPFKEEERGVKDGAEGEEDQICL
jgi:hypothetical protein